MWKCILDCKILLSFILWNYIRYSFYKFKVSRRYKEFEKLHEALVHECSLDKTLLPGKKVIGNRSTGFVKKR